MRHAATVLVTLVGAATLAACSSSTTGSAGPLLAVHSSVTPAPSIVATHVAHTSSAPSASAPSSAPSSFPTSEVGTSSAPTPVGSQPASHVPNELDALLLTGADVGSGYRPTEQSAPSPLPCTPDQPPVDDQLAHVEKAGTSLFDAGNNTQVSEEVYVYGSATDAVRHQQISEAGLACAKGTEGGAALDIAGPTNVAKQLLTNTSKAEAWSIANSEIGGSLVLVRINAVVVQFSFVADRAVHPTISAKTVIDRALAKIIGGR